MYVAPDTASAPPACTSAAPKDERPGAAYFRWRGITPIPLYAAILFLPWREERAFLSLGVGLSILLMGGLLRLWSIGFIGHRARTHSQKTRPLVTQGPYAAMRNPLYLANILIACGFAAGSGLLWYAPVLALLLLVHYHLVVRCEERGLHERHPADYDEYTRSVPRWIPRLFRREVWGAPIFPLRECLYRERSGVLGVTIGVAALVIWAWIRASAG